MTISLGLLILIGGIVGGIISSIAGGASIVSYPVLLLSGVQPIFANITNHGALIFDYAGAIASSKRELASHWGQAGFYAACSTIGAILGTYLLLAFPARVFERVVPILLLLSGLLFIFGQKKPQRQRAMKKKLPKALVAIIMLLMGCYTGYFGGANGVVVLAAFQYMTSNDFLVDNAIKNVICGCGNLVAFIIFVFRSKVYWTQGIILAVGMLIGGYLGPMLLR
ncbi:sulfite exporter TauE/SafE family protein, partial [uncultured Limosilactobacillus sp.]|uniref:sulfite exporter TauE/SafE family protein n=1 Tax=uncultured Limosilactobacillus sp. TaxID=2837629 RepID=UPI0025F871FC